MNSHGRAEATGDTERPVVWRDGVHIRSTPIWCDAERAQGVSFISAAHTASPSHRGQLLGTATTLAMIPERPARGPLAPGTRLPVPYDRPFSLGELRIELIRSGHAAGSAALSLDVGRQRILYVGALGRAGAGLGGEPACRPCDVLVIAADYGHPHTELPEPARAIEETLAFVHDSLSREHIPVLLVSSSGKALDVLDRLGAAGVPAAGHPEFVRAARRARAAGVELPPVRPAGGDTTAGAAVLWPTRARGRLDALRLPAAARVALVSGAALRPEAAREIRAHAAIAWSNQADFPALAASGGGAGAERVYAIGAAAREFAAALRASGRSAEALAAPEQLALF